MPIAVHCSCGKQYSVPDSYAGKRMRCRHCGGVCLVPTPLVPPVPVPTAPINIPINIAPTPLQPKVRNAWKPVVGQVSLAMVAGVFLAVVLSQESEAVSDFLRGFFGAAFRDMAVPGALFGPFILAVVLSRCRVLSIGRWLALAAFFMFVGFFWFFVFAMALAQYNMPWDQGKREAIGAVGGPITLAFFSAIAGCLLAAAVYPKSPKP